MKVELSSNGAYGSRGVLKLDGVDVSRHTESVRIECNVSEVITASVRLLPSDGLDISLDAVAILNVVAVPGYVLIEDRFTDGSRRLRCVPDTATEVRL